MNRIGLVLGLVAVIGCNGEDDDDVGGDDASNMNGGEDSSDQGYVPPGELKQLLEAPYTIPAGQEFYSCTRKTLTEEIVITRFTPINKPGLHHQVFAVDDGTYDDGTVTDNGGGTSTSGPCPSIGTEWTILFASGVESPSLDMPEGVGIKLPAGTQVVLQLHLYNTTDNPIVETSGIKVNDADLSEIQEEAEVVLVGPFGFTIPPNVEDHDVPGTCTISDPVKFFAVFPHMHQLGRHIKVWVDQGATETVVHDAAYDFEDQTFTHFEPMQLTANDQIKVTCTFDNPTNGNVNFGESSDQEMCFAISYWYPKRPGSGAFKSFCGF